MLREIVEERCASPERRHGDVLDYFLEEMKSKTFITKDFIVYIMFGLLFATFESIPTMFTLVFKLIMEHPLVWQELKVSLPFIVMLFFKFALIDPVIFLRWLISFSVSQDEHEAILRNSQTSNSTITWEDYKSMTFTFDVSDKQISPVYLLFSFDFLMKLLCSLNYWDCRLSMKHLEWEILVLGVLEEPWKM